MIRVSPYRSVAASTAAAILYAAISLLIFGSTQSWLTHFVGVDADPMSYIWSLNWWPWAIGHGVYPMVSHYVWYPTGFHMAWADAAPSAALIALPFTLAGNAVLAYDVLMVAAPAAAALSAFFLARYLTRDIFASLFAGYVFGFSSYQISHGSVHLSLVLTFLVPLIVLLSVKRFEGGLSRPRFIMLLALCLLIQFGITMEIFATVCVFGAMTWLAALAFASSTQRRTLFVMALDVMCAAAIVVLVALPWLISMFRGIGDVPYVINAPEQFGTDLLNFVIPTPLTYFENAGVTKVADRFSGGLAENSGYLGIPLIAIVMLWCRESWRTAAGRMLLCLLVVLAVLSIGPVLAIGGRQITVWMPWRALLELPLIRHALPGRVSLYVALIASIVTGYWLAKAQTVRGRTVRFALGLVVILFLFPNLQAISWTAIPFVPFFDRTNVQRALGPSPNLVVLPFFDLHESSPGPSMIWQWQSGMAFTQSGGYVGNIPPAESDWGAVISFMDGKAEANFANDVRMYAASHHVSAIVAGPGTQQSLLDGLEKLGWQAETIDGVRLFRVPQGNTPYYSASGQYWPGPTEWSWMGEGATFRATGGDYVIQLNGSWRPPAVGPAIILVSQDGKPPSSLTVTGATLSVPLPAGHSVMLTSKSTFVPHDYLGTADMRELSVIVQVTQ